MALRELKEALNPEQLQQLQQWLVEAQGESHVLTRYERGVALPPLATAAVVHASDSLAHAPVAGFSSAPIAISSGGRAHWRGSAMAASPMESDDDLGAFPLSRSWDDIEGARSILNLNSPNGFHPIAGAPPVSFSLPTASLPPFPPHSGTSMLTSTVGSMMNGSR